MASIIRALALRARRVRRVVRAPEVQRVAERQNGPPDLGAFQLRRNLRVECFFPPGVIRIVAARPAPAVLVEPRVRVTREKIGAPGTPRSPSRLQRKRPDLLT